MAHKIRSIQHTMKTQKIIELIIGTLVATIVTLQIFNDGVGNVLRALPEVLK
jgi:hypothetical protein